jgi:hypothetical protein
MFDTFHGLLKGSTPDESWGRMTLQTQQVLDMAFQAAGCGL